MVTLSVCIAVQDNAEKILDCLESIKDIADEIIILNAGLSTDLNNICSSYTDKIYNLKETNNSADVWNYSFGLASKDYILWLEPQDIILDADREKLKGLINNMDNFVDVVQMIHNFSDKEHKVVYSSSVRNRIVKRNNYFKWQSGLSHYLTVAGNVINSDIAVTNCGGGEDSISNGLSIFEKSLEMGKNLTNRELYYYAEKLYEGKIYEEAIKYYDLFISQNDGWIGDKLEAVYKISDIYNIKGDKHNEMNYLLRSFEYDLPRAEFLCKIGMVFVEQNEFDKAIYWFDLAARLEKPKDNLGFMREEYWTWFPYLKLCWCNFKKGNYEEAYKHNELALNFSSNDKNLLKNRAALKSLLKKAEYEVQQNAVQDLKIDGMQSKPLKIIQVAPDIYPVPPENYGGIEAVIYELTEALVKMGHDVYLYAAEGSKTSAKLIPYKHKTRGDFNQIADYVLKTMPKDADIIHDHTHISVLGKKELTIPTVCTIHGAMNYRVKYPVYVSKRALQVMGGNHGFYVYNGLSLERYQYCEDKQDYMLYLGRLDAMKGINLAIDVAEKTNKRLVIAGPAHDVEYYKKEVEPRIINNPNIEYIGSVGGSKKQEVLKHAGCVLFPTSWEEPFGLVMIEAMACGTPVLALANGAVPEVLKDFPYLICKDIDEMISKVLESEFPIPSELREYALNNFTSKKMAEGYIEVYKKICFEQKKSNANTNLSLNIIKSNKKLRILQVAPMAFPCPPKDYGGIERVVYDLTEELVKKGHEVFLYAAEGSKSSGKIITYDKSISSAKMIADFVQKTIPENIDIIHDHTHACVINDSSLSIPIVNTIHDSRKNSAKNPVYLCKKALRDVGLGNGFYAYNGINPNDYEFNDKKDKYLIFMGILYAHKGIKYAIEVAERTEQKLIIAGPILDMDYYKKEIEPHIRSNSNIIYAGSVGGSERQKLFKNARCMVFPTVWEEPFGLVMIEAMACGTPVLAFGNGAVPEVLSGFSDFICSNVDEMVEKVQKQVFPEAHILRKYVEDNFSAQKMAENYLDIYNEVIAST